MFKNKHQRWQVKKKEEEEEETWILELIRNN